MMKGGKGNQSMSTRAATLRVSTTVQGQAVPLLFGRYRVNPKLIWANDFTSTKQKTSKKGGGKKGGGDSYTYSAAGCWLLGHWPIRAVTQIWNNKDWYATATDTRELIIQSGGNHGYIDLSGCYNWPWGPGDMICVLGAEVVEHFAHDFNDFGGDGPESLAGDWVVPLWNANYYTPDGQPGNVRDPYIYFWRSDYGNTLHFPAALIGKTVRVTWAFQQRQYKPLSILNLEFEHHLCEGSEFTAHEDQRIPYTFVSGIGSVRFDLGSSDMFPAFTLEAIGAHDIWPDGGCDPSDIIQDLLNGTTRLAEVPWGYAHAGEIVPITHGVNNGQGLPIAISGLDQMWNWTRANGIACSLYLDSQRAAKDVLEELFDVGNCAPVWSGSALKCIPWDEVSAADHGSLYTAATAAGPICDLDDSAFICNGDTPPVTVDRTRQAEAANVVKLQHVIDRWEGLAEGNPRGDFNDYVTTEIEQRSVHQYGPRPADSREMRSITKKAIAQKIASILVKRQAFQRNTYKFSLPVTYSFLEAMDLVTITEPWLGLNKLPVRLLSVKESFDNERGWELACEAERFIYGLNHPSPMELTSVTPFLVVSNADPGSVNSPIFFEPPDSLTSGEYELWIPVSGTSPDWGGCVVWLSADGVEYDDVFTLLSKSTMGALTAELPCHADPDNASTLAVDLTESAGTLATVPAADKDTGRSLCLVGGELVSYQTVALTGANRYNLNALRRGLFGTVMAAHASGSNFARLDDAIVKLKLDASWVGKTLYFKFTSFNTRGGGAQGLADATPYIYTFAGKYNNFLQIIGSNATIDSIDAGANASIRVYGPGGAGNPPASTITIFKSDGSTKAISGATITECNYTTWYWVMYDPVANKIYLLTNPADMWKAVYNGHINLGTVQTVSAGGTGGQGDTGGGGFGGGGDKGGDPGMPMPIFSPN